ncbi:serine hydrolase [Actinocatenispora rupis]|uniref:Serine hydrolase n=1 Tax=Actinocatenispora rupis TaxID=519421 RepID=A0A8J3JGG5_9ACTN|nr:serine hydrolase [Actinocatenispora rupis]GID16269.1 serine hydrolase [Actinocatenispora rupis]
MPVRTNARATVRAAYRRRSRTAGGTWHAYVSVTGPDGAPTVAVDDDATATVQAYSVNKVAVAVAVLDTVDRGRLALDRTVEVTADLVVPGGDGVFGLDGAYPSRVTVGHALATLLTVSDDTAVRLCGLVTPAAEINDVLAAKGFPDTRVEPAADPHRFHLGTTTARQTHDLLWALAAGTLLSPASTAYLLGVLRSPIAYTDGIRRTMSSDERHRVATKAGWYADGRHEAGIVFDPAGRPALTYALFAYGQGDAGNLGATHPATHARAGLGRTFLDATTT